MTRPMYSPSMTRAIDAYTVAAGVRSVDFEILTTVEIVIRLLMIDL